MITAERLLLALDLGHSAQVLVPYAMRFAELLKAGLHVAHVVAHIENFSTVYMPNTSITKMESVRCTEARDALTTFCRTRLDGISGLKTTVLFGDPAQELIRYIDAECISYVLMGTHGRAGLGRFMYGSISDRVARACHVPVILINVGIRPAINKLGRNQDLREILPQAHG